MLPTWNTGVILFLFLITEVISLSYQKRLTNDVSYNELIKLNATCNGLDSCQVQRRTENLRFVNCHCNLMCMELDTCCVDSKYRRPGRVQKAENSPYCEKPIGAISEGVFLVDKCSPYWRGEDSVKDLCHGNPITLNDPFLIVPVSNLVTGLTFRNYFCFICNNPISRLNSPVFWNLKFYSELPNISEQSFPDMKQEDGEWMIENEFVYISAEIPNRAKSRLKWCREHVFSTCPSDWKDAAIKKKCESYTAMVSINGRYGLRRFKNPHCAICNNEDISKIVCTEEGHYSTAGRPPYGYLFAGLFSLEDKVKRCPRNQVFDKFSNKCRAFRCGRNRHVVDGECVYFFRT